MGAPIRTGWGTPPQLGLDGSTPSELRGVGPPLLRFPAGGVSCFRIVLEFFTKRSSLDYGVYLIS